MTSARSASVPASPNRCSMITMVNPYSSRSRHRVSRTAFVPFRSRFDVGSSRTRTLGRMASTAAIATRCCSPKERVLVARSTRCSMPVASSARRERSATSPTSKPRLRGPKATSSATVDPKSCVAGFWKTSPTCVASSATVCSVVLSPSTVTRPLIVASEEWGIRPLRQPAKVLLPQPEGPVRSTNSPGSILSDNSSIAVSAEL